MRRRKRNCINPSRRFCWRSPDFFRQQILGFLFVNDVRNLSNTSHQLREMVLVTRSYQCIVFVERPPTTIGYLRPGSDFGESVVFHSQHFRFIYRTSTQESLRLKQSLSNAVWDENNNHRDGRGFRQLNQFPKQTFPSISIARSVQSTQEHQLLLVASKQPAVSEEPAVDGEDVWEVKNSQRSFLSIRGKDPEVSTDEELDFQGALDVAWKYFQLIAVFPAGVAFPSAEYLMFQLPYWFLKYFPARFAAALPGPFRPRSRSRNCSGISLSPRTIIG
jgi:hypothetical protein